MTARVHPAMIPRSHPLASVYGAYNAVFIEADAAGQLMFYGQGAGGPETASAVLGDLVAVARNRVIGGRGPRDSAHAEPARADHGRDPHPLPRRASTSPTARACWPQVAGVFADHDVSIATVRQEGRGQNGGDAGDGVANTRDATLVIVTHSATDAALASTVEALTGPRRRARRRRGAAGRGPGSSRDRAGGCVMTGVVGGAFVGGPAVALGARVEWPGIIQAYRDRMPRVEDGWEVVTLREGGTPLLPAPHLSELTGCEVLLKIDGANPTGSFKDRGMTWPSPRRSRTARRP